MCGALSDGRTSLFFYNVSNSSSVVAWVTVAKETCLSALPSNSRLFWLHLCGVSAVTSQYENSVCYVKHVTICIGLLLEVEGRSLPSLE
jgi:hypothetical protein